MVQLSRAGTFNGNDIIGVGLVGKDLDDKDHGGIDISDIDLTGIDVVSTDLSRHGSLTVRVMRTVPTPHRAGTPGKGGRAQAGEASGAQEDRSGGQVSVVFVRN